MAGQMGQLERKSIEPIALNVESAKVRAMQHFMSDAVWEEDRILSRYHGMVTEDLGDAEGVLIFDESGFVKKGNDSVGVSRQYCGNVGKMPTSLVSWGFAGPSSSALRRPNRTWGWITTR
jgi:SRSO17 transposase